MNNSDYSYLSTKYDIVLRFGELLDQLQDNIKSLNLQDYVRVDENILGKVVLDYFEDIDRLKEFEEIDRICVSKIYAYETYWIVKRKPIQIVQYCDDERHLYINEIACALIIIAKMYAEMGIEPRQEDERILQFFNLLFYNLKYRVFTQQSLELAIEAFFLGFTTK